MHPPRLLLRDLKICDEQVLHRLRTEPWASPHLDDPKSRRVEETRKLLLEENGTYSPSTRGVLHPGLMEKIQRRGCGIDQHRKDQGRSSWSG